MHKNEALTHIKNKLTSDEELIGFFMAQKPFKIWLFVLIGPLAVLSMKPYYIAVTNKGVHFHLLNLLGKFSKHDFFKFEEIDSLKIGNGVMRIAMKYVFSNGRKLKIKAQKKGLDRIAKIDEATLQYLKNAIRQTS